MRGNKALAQCEEISEARLNALACMQHVGGVLCPDQRWMDAKCPSNVSAFVEGMDRMTSHAESK
jgi:hypothetical protein